MKLFFVFHDSKLTGATIALFNFISVMQKRNINIDIWINNNGGLFIEKLKSIGILYNGINKGSYEEDGFYVIIKRILYYFEFYKYLNYCKPNYVYINTIFNFGELVIAKIKKYDIVLHVHEGLSIIKKNKWKFKIQALSSKIILCPSVITYRVIENYGFKNKVSIINNGVEISDNFLNLEKYNKNIGILFISTIGSIEENKSQHNAIYILKILREKGINARLNLFGSFTDSNYKKKCISLIEQFEIENYVDIYGEILSNEDIYNKTDILLVTSKEETFGMVILEAFNKNIPVISTINGGSSELIIDKFSGFLFDYYDINHAVNLIINISIDYKLRDIVVKNAKSELIKKFDINKLVITLQETLQLNEN